MKKTILLFALVVGIASVLSSCCAPCAAKHKAAQEAKAASVGEKVDS